MDFVDKFNVGEGILWIVVALVLLIQAIRRRRPKRTICWVAGVSFFLFGITDFVEARTDSFPPPWWLMLWKTLCFFGFFSMYLWYLKIEKKLPDWVARWVEKEPENGKGEQEAPGKDHSPP